MAIAQLIIIENLRSDDYSPDAYNALSPDQITFIRQEDLNIISEVYVGLGILIFGVMFVIFFIKIPGKDEKSKLSIKENINILRRNKRYYEGVIAQAFYVGTQIMCWTFIFQYVDNINILNQDAVFEFITDEYSITKKINDSDIFVAKKSNIIIYDAILAYV